MKRFGILLPIAVFLCVLVLAPRVVHAEKGSTDAAENTASSNGEKQADAQAKALAEQRKEAATKREETLKKALDAQQEALRKQSESIQKQQERIKDQRNETFKKGCEARVAGFKVRMQTVVTGVKHRGETLDSILERVQSYVKEKNLSVLDYQALLTDVQAKKALAQSIYASAKQDGSFDCTSSDAAKESLNTFKDVAQQEVDAIKAYKDSVRKLITAVKTAAQAAEGASNAGAQ